MNELDLAHLPNAAPSHDELSPLYFLHIPKTAGTTFNRFLESQFKDDDDELAAAAVPA
jgi:hypothetical protein